MSISKSVVISCAGMGKRLGIGTTKALVEIDGVPLIIRHLRMLDEVEDVRIVVGYQADRVIQKVNEYRKDVTFVFNHDFMHNGTGASVSLAADFANDYILTIDGDLLIHPEDMRLILQEEGEFVGVTTPGTDNPVLVDVADGQVTGFSRDHGAFEWTGVCQVSTKHLTQGEGHVYQLIEPHLPLKYLFLRTKEIDTMNDFDNALKWVRNGYSDKVVVGIVGGMGSYATVDFFRRIVDAFPARYEWDRPRIIIDNNCTMPSRVRALLYGEKRTELVNELAASTRQLLAAGATHIVYACNTSHCFIDEVAALVPDMKRYLLNMIEELATTAREAGIEKAFLLASEGTIASNIYQDTFERQGVRIVSASESQQPEIREFIETVKQNRITDEARMQFARYLEQLGAPTVVLGCTELPVLLGDIKPEGVHVLDPMQAAIDRIVADHTAAHAATAR